MLQFVKSVHIKFSPGYPKNASTYEFIKQAYGRTSRTLNPTCQVDVKTDFDKFTDPSIKMVFENGMEVEYNPAEMTITDINKDVFQKQKRCEFEDQVQDFRDEVDEEEDEPGYTQTWEEEHEEPWLDPLAEKTWNSLPSYKKPWGGLLSAKAQELNTYYTLQRTVAAMEKKQKLFPTMKTILAEKKKELAFYEQIFKERAARAARSAAAQVTFKSADKKPGGDSKAKPAAGAAAGGKNSAKK